jgi:hypothetical protein
VTSRAFIRQNLVDYPYARFNAKHLSIRGMNRVSTPCQHGSVGAARNIGTATRASCGSASSGEVPSLQIQGSALDIRRAPIDADK